MKVLVVYHSQFGNTRQIAQTIARVFQQFGSADCAPLDRISAQEIANYDILVIGSPTQHHGLPPTVADFFHHTPAEVVEKVGIVLFDTRYDQPRWESGSAALGLGKEILDKGGWLLIPPESFFVNDQHGPLKDGEIERAKAWAQHIVARWEAFTVEKPATSNS